MEHTAGQRISPTIVLVRPLSHGGMGTVWVAHHSTLDREVAIKFVSLSVEAGALSRPAERFAREAKAAGQIKSPHVVHTYDHGVGEDGNPYIVMELLEGENLSERIRRLGAMKVSEVARLIGQVAKALGKAHALGIVHRDIKPDNLFLEAGHDELFVKVLDFGIAKVPREADKGGSLTASGVMVGSPYFMSPEQMEDAKTVGVTADTFSLGAVAYFGVTGAFPFQGESPVELYHAKREGAFELPSRARIGCPVGLDAWFRKALAPAPADRFQTPADMAKRFAEAAGMEMTSGFNELSMSDSLGPATPPTRAARMTTEPIFDMPNSEALETKDFVQLAGAGLPIPAPTQRGDTPYPGQRSNTAPGAQTVPGAPFHPMPISSGRVITVTNDDMSRMTPPPMSPLSYAPPTPGSYQPAATAMELPSTAMARPPSRRTGGGGGKIAVLIAAPVLLLAGGAGAYFLLRTPDELLPRCKETEPRTCADVGDELLDNGKRGEAFRYLAVAALRDSRLDAHAKLDKLRAEIGFTAKATAPFKEACAKKDKLACFLHDLMAGEDAAGAALGYLEARCKKKDYPACSELGFVHETDVWGVGRDEEKALGYYRTACTGGDARGCGHLGELFFDGRAGLDKDEKEAVELFKKACDDDDARGCHGLGNAFQKAIGGKPKDEKRAAELFRKACKDGHAVACRRYASCLLHGSGVERDDKRAVEHYEKACDGGDLAACADLGTMHESGKGGLSKDTTKARELYERACKANDQEGCVNLGGLYQLGEGGLGKDDTKAVELYQKACDQNVLSGCRALGSAYHDEIGGLKRDYVKAFALYKRACDGGNLRACVSVGFYHEYGIGGAAKDLALAFEFNQRACDGGEMIGCSNVGTYYERGVGGLPKDEVRAIQLYEKACDEVRGVMSACANLGLAYEVGRGGKTTDTAKAAELYQKVCDVDGDHGCSHLGSMYERGISPISADLARAAQLYEKGCKIGDGFGCTSAGYAYEKGRGVTADAIKAVRFYRLGCDAGHPMGCNNLGVCYHGGKGGLTIDKVRAKELFKKACDGGVKIGCDNLRVP